MNTKKIVAMLIAIVMAGAMLTGCGTSVDHKDYMKDSEVTSTVEDNDKEVKKDSKSETADKADKDEKKDSKETSDKTDKPADNKVAEKKADASDKKSDAGSANAGNSNNSGSASKPSNSGNSGSVSKPSKPSTGSGNSSSANNNSANKPAEKPSKPSGGNTNNGNSGSNNKPTEKPSEPEKPAPHVCNFNIWKDEVSHTEMVTEEYTEQVPKYKYVDYYTCKICGTQFTDIGECMDHCMDVCDSTYKVVTDKIQDGFDTVTKTRQVPKKVIDDPAHYECSCGTRP